MADGRAWMWTVFSKEEIDELFKNTNRIMWDEENGMVIHLTLSNNQCMEFIHNYHTSREMGEHDTESNIFIENFLYDLTNQIQDHLDTESPGWQEQFYGIGPTIPYEDDDNED